MKRVFALIACVFMLTLCMLPASAAGYNGDDYNPTRYYALIPFRYKNITTSYGSVFSSAADGAFYDRTNVTHGWPQDPAYSEVTVEQVGWDDDGGDELVPDILSYTYGMRYYSNPSAYYASYNNYTIKVDGQKPSSLEFELIAEDFWTCEKYWNALSNYATLYFSAAANFDVFVDVIYKGIDPDTNTVEYYSIDFNLRGVLAGAGTFKYIPSWDDVFRDQPGMISGGYVIDKMSVSIDISKFNGSLSVGMLYGNSTVLEDVTPVIETIKEVEVIKHVVKEVPAEDLDLFSWLVAPIDSFFGIEFFPGISLGAIMGVMLAVLIVVAILVLFR